MGCAVRRLKRVLGRRGAMLASYGTVWVLYGYGQLITPQPDQRGLDLLLQAWPLQVWAGLWIATGCAALVAAWMPAGRDVFGFVALVAMVLPWMLGYLVSWWPLETFPRGWVAALIWAAISVPIVVSAGWPEARQLKTAELPHDA